MDELCVKVEGLTHDMNSLTRRVTMCEDTNKTIQDLLISVQKISMTMESMLAEQKRQAEQIARLENIPRERSRKVWTTIITAAISCAVTAIVTRFIALI